MTKEQFIELIAAEQESLRRFLRGLCRGDGFTADDIAQEALLKAYLSFKHFEGRSRFSTWLFRIGYNCWYDHIRKVDKSMALPSIDDEGKGAIVRRKAMSVADESDPTARNDQYDQLYMAIGSLSRQEQAVILLYYMEEKSIREIELITEMPSGTIRSHLSRGREHLRAFLEK